MAFLKDYYVHNIGKNVIAIYFKDVKVMFLRFMNKNESDNMINNTLRSIVNDKTSLSISEYDPLRDKSYFRTKIMGFFNFFSFITFLINFLHLLSA